MGVIRRDEWTALRSAVQSLSSSTDVAVEGAGAKIAWLRANGNSENQRFIVERSLWESNVVVVANGRFAMAIALAGAINPAKLPSPDEVIRFDNQEAGNFGVQASNWRVLDVPVGAISRVLDTVEYLGFSVPKDGVGYGVFPVAVAIPERG